jgi:hypothetical protein
MILLGKTEIETMTSPERIAGLHTALINIHKNNIPGDFVECGIYKAGNIVIAKKFFDSVNLVKTVYGYDTFEGMTPPTEKDSKKAKRVWNGKAKCEAGHDTVLEILSGHNINETDVRLIKGDVGKTLRVEDNLPKQISILRLDTDFYDSTKVELEVLYPRLESGGYLIIDDYGHWAGCKAAVNEYFGEEFVKEHFEILDYTGIMYRKP